MTEEGRPLSQQALDRIADSGAVVVGICHLCDRRTSLWHCEAFPDGAGIPVEVSTGEFDHTKPVQGDHGLQFKPFPEGVPEDYLAQRLRAAAKKAAAENK